METLKKYTPMRTLKNMSRTADRYGSVTFISFLGAVLSRLAYMNDNKFLDKYTQIMGPIITPSIMEGIAKVPHNQLQDLLDDEKMFNLPNKGPIDFIAEQMPQNINIINDESVGNSPIEKIKKYYSSISKKISGGMPEQLNQDVKYISIGWSNYGEIFVVADKRMNSIFVIFRGTYSAKTASLYTKPTSSVPLSICSNNKDEKFLYGIFKPTAEMIHTIIESVRYLASNVLNATSENPVKIFTIGHSLGGAMCTMFSYLWMNVKNTNLYKNSPYDIVSDNIVCISLGAPRCMSKSVAKKFCDYVNSGRILYKRLTTRGDPVTAVPPSQFGFTHPCSDDDDSRKKVSVDCNNTIKVRPPVPSYIDYAQNLDCQNYKTRSYITDAWAHTNYLDIMYTHALDITNFTMGVGVAKEVSRQNKSTVCRIVIGTLIPVNVGGSLIFVDQKSSANKPGTANTAQKEIELTDTPKKPSPSFKVQCKAGFFNVDNARINPQYNTDEQQEEKGEIELTEFGNANKQTGGITLPKFKLGGPVEEDCKMTMKAFDELIGKIESLPALEDGHYTPMNYNVNNLFNNIFTETAAPNISCQPFQETSTTNNVISTGGKKTNRRFRRIKQLTRRHHIRAKPKKTKRRVRVRI